MYELLVSFKDHHESVSGASTSIVLPTTAVTEFFRAFTTHVIASLCFFDPVLAEWTLFEFLTFAKFEECFVKLLRVLSKLIFGAALISVEEGTAI